MNLNDSTTSRWGSQNNERALPLFFLPCPWLVKAAMFNPETMFNIWKPYIKPKPLTNVKSFPLYYYTREINIILNSNRVSQSSLAFTVIQSAPDIDYLKGNKRSSKTVSFPYSSPFLPSLETFNLIMVTGQVHS